MTQVNVKWYHWAIGGVVVVGVGYAISRVVSERTIDAPAQPYTEPRQTTGVRAEDHGSTEERVAGGLIGLGRDITRGVFEKVARDDAARERRLAEHSRDMDKSSLLDDSEDDSHYDPVAAFARKHAQA